MLSNDCLLSPPPAVFERSQMYLQDSMDISNIFLELFERRNSLIADSYQRTKKESTSSGVVNWTTVIEDKDWRLTEIAREVVISPSFNEIVSKSRLKKKKYTESHIADFFTTNYYFKLDCYSKASKTGKPVYFLRNWRRKQWSIADDSDVEDD